MQRIRTLHYKESIMFYFKQLISYCCIAENTILSNIFYYIMHISIYHILVVTIFNLTNFSTSDYERL